MIIVDTSAIVETLAGSAPDAALVHRLATDDLHAPHLLDVEVLHTLRVLITRRAATADKIEAARHAFEHLALTRYPHTPLRTRIWELRNNLSAYDATFVALAEELSAPLVTTDGRIAEATGLRATVEVYDRTP